MTDPLVIVALIGAGAGVVASGTSIVVAIIQRGGLKRDVGEIKDQVKNDHGTNLRHDIDAVLAAIARTDAKVSNVEGQIVTVDGKVSLLHAGWFQNRHDIDALMDTESRRRQRTEQEMWGQRGAGLRRDRRA